MMAKRNGIAERPWWRIVGPLLAIGGSASVAVPAIGQVATSPQSSLGASTALAATGQNGLLVTATAEALYDSNQLRSTDSLPLPAGTRRDDFRYSPVLSAIYGRNSGLISLSVNGLVGRDFFQYNRYLDRNQYLGGGSAVYHAGSSCQVGVMGNYASRQAGIRDTTASSVPIDTTTAMPADDVGRVIDNVVTASTYGANAGCGSPTGRLTFGGNYAHSTIRNGSAIRNFGDSDADTFAGNIGLGILRPGQLSLNGSYTTIGYPTRGSNVLVPALLLNTGVKTYRIGLSFSRPIGTKLSGSIGASYLRSDPSGGQAAYSSPAYNIGLNYIPSSRLSFGLSGSRDIVPSTTAGALFRVVDLLELSGQYSLGTSIKLTANAGFIGNNYKQSFAIPGEPARSSDTTANFGLGAIYSPRRLFDIAVHVDQSIRTSSPVAFNYSSTRAGITLAVHI